MPLVVRRLHDDFADIMRETLLRAPLSVRKVRKAAFLPLFLLEKWQKCPKFVLEKRHKIAMATLRCII